jgi:hypothetical protein
MGRKWYYSHDGKKKFGPVRTARLRQLARSGALQPVSLVLLEGGSRWVKAGSVKGLFPEEVAEGLPPVAEAVPSPGPSLDASPEKEGSGSCLLPAFLAALLVLLLGSTIAVVLRPDLNPLTRLRLAAASTGPTQPGNQEEAEPELFENPPPPFSALPKAKQAELQQKNEATYLDPAASDKDHIAAANGLLALADGHTSLLKGLDRYGSAPEPRRRYRWCLQYLCVAQHTLDLKRPPKPGKPSGIIPAEHVPRMVQLLRDLDPKKSSERAQFDTTLDYLEQHPEHAGPTLPVLRELRERHTGDADLAKELQSAITAAEKKS